MVGGVNMNVRFMDTSIVMNLLEVPHMCADAESVKSEFAKAVAEKETLILPMSTIIESGNHIAHITNGTIRREKALKFQEFLKKTAREEAPWTFYGVELTKEDLEFLADEFPNRALHMGMGIGDMSIIRFYEKYKETTPGIGRIMIWSTDVHLAGYREMMTMKRRNNR